MASVDYTLAYFLPLYTKVNHYVKFFFGCAINFGWLILPEPVLYGYYISLSNVCILLLLIFSMNKLSYSLLKFSYELSIVLLLSRHFAQSLSFIPCLITHIFVPFACLPTHLSYVRDSYTSQVSMLKIISLFVHLINVDFHFLIFHG